MLAISLEQVKNGYNAIEPFIWYGVGLLCIPALRRRASLGRRLLLAGLLIAFGTSDFFESEAWWTPWWLLGWKAVCLGAIAVILWGMRRGHMMSDGPLRAQRDRPLD